MKRDMDLVRRILLDFESSGAFQTSDPTEAGHVAIMLDAGLVDAAVGCDSQGTPVSAWITRLTWAGHDFIDNARSPEVWRRVKDAFPGGLVSASFEIVSALLAKAASAVLGV